MKISKNQRLINKLLESTTESICGFTSLRVITCQKKYQFRTDGAYRIINPDGSVKTEWSYGSLAAQNYRDVRICLDGEFSMVRLHRIIAFLFIPNPEPIIKPLVNHLISTPGKPLDNSVSNLNWTDHYNNCGIESKQSRRIGQYTLNGELVREWFAANQELIAAGFHSNNVYSCCNEKIPHHKGFIWKYLDVEEHAAYKALSTLDVKKQAHNTYQREYKRNRRSLNKA